MGLSGLLPLPLQGEGVSAWGPAMTRNFNLLVYYLPLMSTQALLSCAHC